MRGAAIGVGLSTVLIGACTSSDRGMARDAPTAITVLISGTPNILAPFALGSSELLFDAPFGYRDGGVGPKLVVGEERLPDGKTFRYRLRSGVRWHDGVPFTTEDIAFTWRLLEHPSVGRQDATSRTLAVEDDSTFTITYHRGSEGPLNYETYLPVHLLGGLDPEEVEGWEFWRRPIGYGAYRFVRTVAREYVELEANPDYYLGRPTIDRVFLKVGGNPFLELRSGSVDLAIVDNNREAKRLAEDPGFNAYWYVSAKLRHLYWNLRHPILQDVRVRRALTLAIDRTALLQALDFPNADSGDPSASRRTRLWARPWDVWATQAQVERGDYPDPEPHDPPQARELLDAAGWLMDEATGIRYRNGEPLEFNLLATNAHDLALLLQAQLGTVGARVIVDATDGAVGLEQFRAGDFDAALMSGNWGLAEQALTGRGTPSGESYTGYRNPEFNSLFWALDSTWTAEEHEAALERLWPFLRQHIPATLLVPSFSGMTVVRARVRGLDSPLWGPVERIPWLWIEE